MCSSLASCACGERHRRRRGSRRTNRRAAGRARARRSRRRRRSGTGPARRRPRAGGAGASAPRAPRWRTSASGAGAAPLRPGRVAGHQLGGGRHQLAHAAVEIDPAFDVVLADLADLAGDEVGERRQIVQAQRHRGVAWPMRRPPGRTTAIGRPQRPEALLEGTCDRGHGWRSRCRERLTLARSRIDCCHGRPHAWRAVAGRAPARRRPLRTRRPRLTR